MNDVSSMRMERIDEGDIISRVIKAHLPENINYRENLFHIRVIQPQIQFCIPTGDVNDQNILMKRVKQNQFEKKKTIHRDKKQNFILFSLFFPTE